MDRCDIGNFVTLKNAEKRRWGSYVWADDAEELLESLIKERDTTTVLLLKLRLMVVTVLFNGITIFIKTNLAEMVNVLDVNAAHYKKCIMTVCYSMRTKNSYWT